MRKSDTWMKQLDERVLEHLRRESWSTPRVMARERSFEASAAHIRERCAYLRYVGFVSRIHGETYELTTDGRLYLDGEVDAQYRPRPSAGSVLRTR